MKRWREPNRFERWWQYSKVRDAYYYIRNRFFRKYYLIDIKAMTRHQWYDLDYRIFHVVFQILVDYVEGELGHDGKRSMDYEREKFANGDWVHPNYVAYMRTPWTAKILKRKEWAEQLGLAHLDWEISLSDPTSKEYECWVNDDGTETPTCVMQSDKAKKVKDLYLWYKYERPKRMDPWDAFSEPEILTTGRWWKEVKLPNGNTRLSDEHRSPEEHAELMKYYDQIHNLEQQYEDEDTEKAQQILAIRQFLWT